jgi:tetratricopeptide (TPR) repeat protein
MNTLACRVLVPLLCISLSILLPAFVAPACAQKGNAGEYEKDLAECRYDALKNSGSSMDRDFIREAVLLEKCMEVRGYRRKVKEPPASSAPAPIRLGPQIVPQGSPDSLKMSNQYYEIGLEYYKKGHWTEAANAFDQSIEWDHENADAYFQLGLAYHQLGQSKEAFQIFHSLEKIDSEQAIKLFNIIRTPVK